MFEPVGTCFAMSGRYLLTVVRLDSGADTVSRLPNGSVSLPRSYLRVTMDYAIVEDVSGEEPLAPMPISLRLTEPDTHFKVFHCPVGLFNDGYAIDVSVFTK